MDEFPVGVIEEYTVIVFIGIRRITRKKSKGRRLCAAGNIQTSGKIKIIPCFCKTQ